MSTVGPICCAPPVIGHRLAPFSLDKAVAVADNRHLYRQLLIEPLYDNKGITFGGGGVLSREPPQ